MRKKYLKWLVDWQNFVNRMHFFLLDNWMRGFGECVLTINYLYILQKVSSMLQMWTDDSTGGTGLNDAAGHIHIQYMHIAENKNI